MSSEVLESGRMKNSKTDPVVVEHAEAGWLFHTEATQQELEGTGEPRGRTDWPEQMSQMFQWRSMSHRPLNTAVFISTGSGTCGVDSTLPLRQQQDWD